MNTILEDSNKMSFHTNLRIVFEALGGRQKEYNWLITDYECNIYPDERVPENNQFGAAAIISGEELTEIVNNNEIQFIWGVLSGFHKDINIQLDKLDVYPYAADGNPNFWVEKPLIQHPFATVEIVCWDSTLTLLLSMDNDLSVRFRNNFTEAEDLNKYNKRNL